MLTPFLLKLYGILFNKFHDSILTGQASIKSTILQMYLPLDEYLSNGQLTMMDNTE